MEFFIELEPAPWKVGNASHFINIERRLKQQVHFLRDLRDNKKLITAGPYAILNAIAPRAAYIINTDSWESLSRILHEDPMMIYQGPRISYLANWEEAMAKHADTVGSEHGRESLEEDVRIDEGLNLTRAREPWQDVLFEQSREIQMLRAEIARLSKQIEDLEKK